MNPHTTNCYYHVALQLSLINMDIIYFKVFADDLQWLVSTSAVMVKLPYIDTLMLVQNPSKKQTISESSVRQTDVSAG